MGNHNSHVVNQSDQTVKVVLRDSDGRNTTQILGPWDVCVIPTPEGRVNVSVFKETSWGGFSGSASATYPAHSDTSFIVKSINSHPTILRSVYGNIHKVDNRYGQNLWWKRWKVFIYSDRLCITYIQLHQKRNALCVFMLYYDDSSLYFCQLSFMYPEYFDLV